MTSQHPFLSMVACLIYLSVLARQLFFAALFGSAKWKGIKSRIKCQYSINMNLSIAICGKWTPTYWYEGSYWCMHLKKQNNYQMDSFSFSASVVCQREYQLRLQSTKESIQSLQFRGHIIFCDPTLICRDGINWGSSSSIIGCTWCWYILDFELV